MIDSMQAIRLVEDELGRLYQALSQGMDVAPAARSRLEGKIELLLDTGALQWPALRWLIDDCHQRCWGEPAAEAFWQWQQQGDVFCLPGVMQQAPVYKS